jgi:hypothetical protein
MHLSRLYEQVFVAYILQMFNESTESGLAWLGLACLGLAWLGLAGITFVFNFSSHVVKQVESKCI